MQSWSKINKYVSESCLKVGKNRVNFIHKNIYSAKNPE